MLLWWLFFDFSNEIKLKQFICYFSFDKKKGWYKLRSNDELKLRVEALVNIFRT